VVRYNLDVFKPQGAANRQNIGEGSRQNCLLKWLQWAFTKKMEMLAEIVYLCYGGCDAQTFASKVYFLLQI